ncbi:MAG: trypsin-like serine protease [Oligoflexia bacterium]|nr:trypsin-like serine protease [Oligoflexia bacterium]
MSDKLILTAAHCLIGKLPEDFLVNFSADQLVYDRHAEIKDARELEGRFLLRRVKAFRIHPNFDLKGEGDHDIAVILLQTPAPSTALPVKILPPDLLDPTARSTALEQQNLPVTLLATGILDEKTYAHSAVLRSVTVPGRFEGPFVITDQTQGAGACNGDSGGPAFAEWDGTFYQVGIISRPHGNSRSCHEEGQLMNPALDGAFLESAMEELLS